MTAPVVDLDSFRKEKRLRELLERVQRNKIAHAPPGSAIPLHNLPDGVGLTLAGVVLGFALNQFLDAAGVPPPPHAAVADTELNNGRMVVTSRLQHRVHSRGAFESAVFSAGDGTGHILETRYARTRARALEVHEQLVREFGP